MLSVLWAERRFLLQQPTSSSYLKEVSPFQTLRFILLLLYHLRLALVHGLFLSIKFPFHSTLYVPRPSHPS
jgi:hypothetical protein